MSASEGGLGPCAFCPEPAITKINDTGACVAHLDDAFAPVGTAIRRLRDFAAASGEGSDG